MRIRLSNPVDKATPLTIGAASIGLELGTVGPQVVAGSSRKLTFGGKPGVTLPPGADYVYSDPVAFKAAAQQNVVVSLYLAGAREPQDSTATWNTSYATASGAGDHTQDETGAPFTSTTALAGYALTAIDVLTDQANGAVVGLGSSTFQGFESTPDGYDRVLDDLSVRVNNELPYGKQKGIVNAGIGGDTLHAGLSRLQRDVFDQTDVTGVILYDINDLAQGRTVGQVEADYRTAITESHARGLRVFCPTWAPESTDLSVESERHEINSWLLKGGACDGTVDWDAVLRNPANPDTYNPTYLSDTIHPNKFGHQAIADAVPLDWFTLGPYLTAGRPTRPMIELSARPRTTTVGCHRFAFHATSSSCA